MDFNSLVLKHVITHPVTQYIIVDTGIPTPGHVTENIFKSIQNVVCLVQKRVQMLGVALINSTFQQVLSLSNPQTQLPKIIHSLKTVIDMGKCRARIPMVEFIDSIHMGIRRAIDDFQSVTDDSEGNKNNTSDLQITILTMKNGFDIKCHVEEIIRLVPTGRLNKVQVVELLEDYIEEDYSKTYDTTASCVEFIKMPGSAMNLDKLMKQIFINMSTAEREHVRVILKNIIILCDIQECLILPDPLAHNPEIESSSEREVIQLQVVERLSSEGLCETQVFGSPVALVPTQCSGINWSDRQVNHQHFSSLNEKVMSADEYLVVKYEVKGQPLQYFVLMPGRGLMLVKNLMSAEMGLPPVETKYVQVSSEVDRRVTDALMLLPSLDTYQLSDFSSGLYRHLVDTTLQPHSVQEKRPLCTDPSHKSVFLGIEIKKTTMGKLKTPKRKKRSVELPELNDADQQSITQFLSKKKQL